MHIAKETPNAKRMLLGRILWCTPIRKNPISGRNREYRSTPEFGRFADTIAMRTKALIERLSMEMTKITYKRKNRVTATVSAKNPPI